MGVVKIAADPRPDRTVRVDGPPLGRPPRNLLPPPAGFVTSAECAQQIGVKNESVLRTMRANKAPGADRGPLPFYKRDSWTILYMQQDIASYLDAKAAKLEQRATAARARADAAKVLLEQPS